MQKAYTIRIHIITDCHNSNSILHSGKYLVYIIVNTLWKLLCLLKETTAGCVIGICSNLISEFTY